MDERVQRMVEAFHRGDSIRAFELLGCHQETRDGVDGWVVSLSSRVQRDVAQAKILYYLRKDWIKEIVMAEGRSVGKLVLTER